MILVNFFAGLLNIYIIPFGKLPTIIFEHIALFLRFGCRQGLFHIDPLPDGPVTTHQAKWRTEFCLLDPRRTKWMTNESSTNRKLLPSTGAKD